MAEEALIKKYFDEKAPDYIRYYQGESIWAEAFRIRKSLVLEMLTRKGKILDIGCGPGILAPEVLQTGSEFWGIDLSWHMIRQCKEKFSQNKHVQVQLGSIEALPFANNKFDGVIAMGVLEYLPVCDRAIKEMVRVLKSGGELIITVPNRWSPYRLWYKFAFKPMAYIWLLIRNRYRNIKGGELHSKEFRGTFFKRCFSEEGCSIEDIAYYCFNLLPAPLDAWFPRLTRTFDDRLERFRRSKFRWLGTAFVIKAVKN